MAFFQQHLRHFQVSRLGDFFQRGAVVVNRFTNQSAQIIHPYLFEHETCLGDGVDTAFVRQIIMPTAPRISFNSFNNLCLYRILVNVSEECDRIIEIIHRLAFEPVLKQIPASGILGVVLTGIRYCQRLDNIRKFLLLRGEHDMNMVGHQAIGVDVTHAFLAITIEFLCKSKSFFSFYKRKLKKRINFPVPVIQVLIK